MGTLSWLSSLSADLEIRLLTTIGFCCNAVDVAGTYRLDTVSLPTGLLGIGTGLVFKIFAGEVLSVVSLNCPVKYIKIYLVFIQIHSYAPGEETNGELRLSGIKITFFCAGTNFLVDPRALRLGRPRGDGVIFGLTGKVSGRAVGVLDTGFSVFMGTELSCPSSCRAEISKNNEYFFEV